MDEIKVYVVKYPDRNNLVMRYVDPLTGKPIARSTGTTRRKDAEKVAAKWEAELQEGRYQKRCRMSWEEFSEVYIEDGTGNLKPKSIGAYMTTLNTFTRLCRPQTVRDLTTAKVTTFAKELRKARTVTVGKGKRKRRKVVKLSEARVACHLRQLKVIARWAHRQGYLATVPVFDMPKAAKGAKRMKGRPITTEEFERMLAKVSDVVGDKHADSYKLLLRGIWASGLRLGEALALRWDQQPDGVTVLLDGRKSVLAFDADSQKSGKVQLVPLAPEAVHLLEPHREERGPVFWLPKRDLDKVSKIITKIGKAAQVVVDTKTGKAASAHDLRRAFGYRWSRRVMPAVLKELMRHASIETTMTYYVGQNAEATAAELWRVSGNKSGNNGLFEAPDTTPANDVSHYNETTRARSSAG